MKYIMGSIQLCREAPSPSTQCMAYNKFTDQITLFGKAASLGR